MRVSLHATENAQPQYIKVRPPEDHPFLKFQAVDLRFDLSIDTGTGEWFGNVSLVLAPLVALEAGGRSCL
jgi:hypothetical protein